MSPHPTAFSLFMLTYLEQELTCVVGPAIFAGLFLHNVSKLANTEFEASSEETVAEMTTALNQTGEEMPEALVEELRGIARQEKLTYYSEIAPLLGIDIGNEYFGALVGRVLDRVNRHEYAASRPLLSAIVVSKETGWPGRGYFGCAKDIGRYSGKSDEDAWIDELKLVYEYWTKH